MTLDEAIKHVEEVAEEESKLCKRYDDASGYTRSHNEKIRTSCAKDCEKNSIRCRQLAEWLKDYKRLKEQEPKTGHWIWCVGAYKCSNCEKYAYFSDKEVVRYCPNCGAKMTEYRGGGSITNGKHKNYD